MNWYIGKSRSNVIFEYKNIENQATRKHVLHSPYFEYLFFMGMKKRINTNYKILDKNTITKIFVLGKNPISTNTSTANVLNKENILFNSPSVLNFAREVTTANLRALRKQFFASQTTHL